MGTEETSWCTGTPNIAGLNYWEYNNPSTSSLPGGITCTVSSIVLGG
jgi:hypothetical protein